MTSLSRSIISGFFLVILLAGCARRPDAGKPNAPSLPETVLSQPGAPGASTAAPRQTLSASATLAASTTVPAAGPGASPSPTPQAETAAPTALMLCSPLEGYGLSELQAAINNPYHPPRPGYDDPHHGVDFAVTSPGSQVALSGHPVQAVLGGQVAAVIQDRFPYGNAVLIETPLETLPAGWPALPTQAPTLQPQPALTCPDPARKWDVTGPRSLYLLYAHMQAPPGLESGEQVACGQVLGAIGSSGNALNPHLHLETRLGPAKARFSSLAHYDASATPEEMDNYCTWRVRGVFQMFDPLQLLAHLP